MKILDPQIQKAQRAQRNVKRQKHVLVKDELRRAIIGASEPVITRRILKAVRGDKTQVQRHADAGSAGLPSNSEQQEPVRRRRQTTEGTHVAKLESHAR